MFADGSTLPRYLPHAKAERLVAVTRLVLAGYSIFAGVLTGMHREPHGPLALSILGAWGVLATAVWMRTRSGKRIRVAVGALIPILDLLLIAALILSSGGAVSAYFPLLVLPFFAVSLMYGRRVMVWTGLVAMTTYLLVSLSTPQRAANPRLFVMRIGFLLIMGTSVLRRSEFDVRMRSDALKLAAWPQPTGLELDEFVRTLLAHAADLLRAPRVLLAWESITGTRQLVRWDGASMTQLDPQQLAEHVAVPSILSAGFDAEMVEGRLFFVGRRDFDSDDATLAEIVARLFGSSLEQTTVQESLRRAAAMEERLRMSRDLHDTLMQSMAALALQIDASRRVIETDAADAQQRLGAVGAQLAEAQTALRALVDDLRPDALPRRDSLPSRLGDVAAAVMRQWGLSATVDADETVALAEPLATEVCLLVAECLTNAARHATATHVVVRVSAAGNDVRIEVEDDGRGFPFHGRYDLEDLVTRRRGPWSLKERVLALRGSMTLESSPNGSRIEIALPAGG